MDIEFQNQELENYFTGNYTGKQKFAEFVLRAFRRKINLMENALTLKELIPAEATHPGLLILDEIETLGITQKEATNKMDMATTTLNELIAGKRSLTPDLALKLEDFFGIDAEYWLRLQIKYELDTLRIKHKKEFEKKDVPGKLRVSMLRFISQNAAAL